MSEQDCTVIFIVGVGRSGTSLLHAMLASHEDVALTPETAFYRTYISNLRQRISLERSGLALLASVLGADKRFARLGISVDDCIGDYKRRFGDKLSLVTFYRNLLAMYAASKNKLVSGDKDPRLLAHVDQLASYYPTAKIIHVIRDPRDVMVSRLKADWSKKYPFLLQVLTCNAQLRLGSTKARSLGPDVYAELRYEDLIATPGSSLSRICRFIGIQYDDRMLAFQSAATELVSNDEMQWKSTTLGPLLATNRDKWRSQLSHNKILTVEQVSVVAFGRYEYQRSIVKLSIVEKLWTRVLQIFRYAYDTFYRVVK